MSTGAQPAGKTLKEARAMSRRESVKGTFSTEVAKDNAGRHAVDLITGQPRQAQPRNSKKANLGAAADVDIVTGATKAKNSPRRSTAGRKKLAAQFQSKGDANIDPVTGVAKRHQGGPAKGGRKAKPMNREIAGKVGKEAPTPKQLAAARSSTPAGSSSSQGRSKGARGGRDPRPDRAFDPVTGLPRSSGSAAKSNGHKKPAAQGSPANVDPITGRAKKPAPARRGNSSGALKSFLAANGSNVNPITGERVAVRAVKKSSAGTHKREIAANRNIDPVTGQPKRKPRFSTTGPTPSKNNKSPPIEYQNPITGERKPPPKRAHMGAFHVKAKSEHQNVNPITGAKMERSDSKRSSSGAMSRDFNGTSSFKDGFNIIS